ncbi:hypothetical protein AVEN_208212-1 [Araneus ventricosus]|uniref:Uncharacterized protein n=1 Tax=Araneus ventricosus TaxID=182803 RepID=A0A4Y2LG14_ARAVE|nr:hypothetical protein AVEN_208212-1 [Araneus ventricosus]
MARLSPIISPLRAPLMTTCPTAFSPLSEQQPAEIRPTSIEVAWPVVAGLGVRVLRHCSFFTLGTNLTSIFGDLNTSIKGKNCSVLSTSHSMLMI